MSRNTSEEHTFHSLPPLETLLPAVAGSLRQLAMVFATPAQYLPWGYFFQGLKTGLPQATTALGSDIFDYYAHHPEEAAIFQKAMQAITVDVTAEIGQRLKPRNHCRREVWRVLAEQGRENLLEIARRNRAQIEDRQERVKALRSPRPFW